MRDQSSLEAAAIVAIGRHLGLAGFVDLVKYNGFLGSSGAVVKLPGKLGRSWHNEDSLCITKKQNRRQHGKELYPLVI